MVSMPKVVVEVPVVPQAVRCLGQILDLLVPVVHMVAVAVVAQLILVLIILLAEAMAL
jgi:hypothetical protein